MNYRLSVVIALAVGTGLVFSSLNARADAPASSSSSANDPLGTGLLLFPALNSNSAAVLPAPSPLPSAPGVAPQAAPGSPATVVPDIVPGQLKLQGYLHVSGRTTAWINGNEYRQGDRIRGLLLRQIRTDSNAISLRLNHLQLHLTLPARWHRDSGYLVRTP